MHEDPCHGAVGAATIIIIIIIEQYNDELKGYLTPPVSSGLEALSYLGINLQDAACPPNSRLGQLTFQGDNLSCWPSAEQTYREQRALVSLITLQAPKITRLSYPATTTDTRNAEKLSSLTCCSTTQPTDNECLHRSEVSSEHIALIGNTFPGENEAGYKGYCMEKHSRFLTILLTRRISSFPGDSLWVQRMTGHTSSNLNL